MMMAPEWIIGVTHASDDVAPGYATTVYVMTAGVIAVPPLVNVTPTVYVVIPAGATLNVNVVPGVAAAGVVRVPVVAKVKSEKKESVVPRAVTVQTMVAPE